MTGSKGLSASRVVTSSSSPSYGGKFARSKGAQEVNPNNRRVYVGNLKFEVSWQDLKDHMRSAGEVVRADILTDANGRSKGCGLVEFASAKDARKAITTLNDTDLQGRLIFVREDRESVSGSGTGAPTSTGRDSQPHASHAPQLGVSKRVYVGNLSWDVEWQDLKDHMRQAGDVAHADVLKEANGRSKGCGIVEYSNIRDANNAILTLNDTELKGRLIFVREDREAVPAVAGSASMGGAHGGSNRLYVGNLDYKTRWFELKDHFRNAGNVLRADVAMEDDGVRSRGYGIVEFATAEEAAYAAQQLNNTELNGRPIFVREDREEKRRM